MAEKPKQTYDELVAENAALRLRSAKAEAESAKAANEVRDAMAERAIAKRKPKRVLDPAAKSAFGRPYDGR
jgi:hypothetical protein